MSKHEGYGKGSAPDNGHGMSSHKGKTPAESVDGFAHSNVPGGESKKGTWIDMEGPNNAKHAGHKGSKMGKK
jgi:hypothetical protein